MPAKNASQRKAVLITGAARRIGAEMARYLHANGLNVIVHYHTSDHAAKKLCGELNQARPSSAFSLRSNISNIAVCQKLIQKAVNIWGRLDVLISNASVFQKTTMGKITEFTWNTIIGTNLKAPFFLAQAAAPYLTKYKGTIINIADIHGKRPLRYYPVYSISKGGLLMLTQALARELGPAIRVNAISPGPTVWPERENAMSLEQQSELIERTVLKRHGDPFAIAQAAYFLIEQADNITGFNMIIDNGRFLLSKIEY